MSSSPLLVATTTPVLRYGTSEDHNEESCAVLFLVLVIASSTVVVVPLYSYSSTTALLLASSPVLEECLTITILLYFLPYLTCNDADLIVSMMLHDDDSSSLLDSFCTGLLPKISSLCSPLLGVMQMFFDAKDTFLVIDEVVEKSC